MLIVNQKHKKKIAELKKLITSHQKEEEKVFKTICKDIGIRPDGLGGDCLFDHLYNDSDWVLEFGPETKEDES